MRQWRDRNNDAPRRSFVHRDTKITTHALWREIFWSEHILDALKLGRFVRQTTDFGLIKLDLPPTLSVVDTHLFNQLDDLDTSGPAFLLELLETATRCSHRLLGVVKDTVLAGASL